MSSRLRGRSGSPFTGGSFGLSSAGSVSTGPTAKRTLFTTSPSADN
ncbi:MAG TPA: hypothetical protein VGL13_15960 [Polyangiaceae bacterium]